MSDKDTAATKTDVGTKSNNDISEETLSIGKNKVRLPVMVPRSLSHQKTRLAALAILPGIKI